MAVRDSGERVVAENVPLVEVADHQFGLGDASMDAGVSRNRYPDAVLPVDDGASDEEGADTQVGAAWGWNQPTRAAFRTWHRDSGTVHGGESG